MIGNCEYSSRVPKTNNDGMLLEKSPAFSFDVLFLLLWPAHNSGKRLCGQLAASNTSGKVPHVRRRALGS